MVSIRESKKQKSRRQPPKLGRKIKATCCNWKKASPSSIKESPCQVCVQLGGHGGCFTNSNSPEMVRARDTSESKSQTTTAPNKTENQIMLLQLMESLFPIHPQRTLSSSCSPWWSWWWFQRLKKSRNGESWRNK
jgi:hypothetical protein